MANSHTASSIQLDQLRLDDARSLLNRDANLQLPQVDSPQEYLQCVIDGLCELSLKDPLTGLANRRHFTHVLERTIDTVARSGDPALLLMIDIDHFKKVNDEHGHHAGDLVLKAVADSLSTCVRPMDTVARFGGEEFAIVLPNCHTYYGGTIAERIRETLQALRINIAIGVDISVTVSIGGAYAPEWVRSTAALWTERADVQLYHAKSQGRNLVRLDTQQEIFVSAEEKNMLFGHLAIGDPAWIEGVNPDAAAAAAAATSAQRVN